MLCMHIMKNPSQSHVCTRIVWTSNILLIVSHSCLKTLVFLQQFPRIVQGSLFSPTIERHGQNSQCGHELGSHPTHRAVFLERFQMYATFEGFYFQHDLETLSERVEGGELVWEGLTVIVLK